MSSYGLAEMIKQSYTKTGASILPGRGQKFIVVVGGWWWWVCKPILVFSLGFDQAEQYKSFHL
jgi:hypothetical protein